MRRSRADVEMGRLLRIGQEWRRRADGTVWTVSMPHPRDRVVVLRRGREQTLVTFDQLRHDWKWIARHQEAA